MLQEEFITVRTLMKVDAYVRKSDISAIEPLFNFTSVAGSIIHLRGGSKLDVKELPELLYQRIK